MSIFDNHHAPSESCNCDPDHTVYMSPEGFAEHIAFLVWAECCEAFAWAIENGSVTAAFDYVPKHNPYSREGDQE